MPLDPDIAYFLDIIGSSDIEWTLFAYRISGQETP